MPPPITIPYPTPSNTLTSSLLGTASGLVAYAQGRVAAVDGFIANLSSQVLTLQPPVITPEFPTGGAAPAISIPDLPTFQTPVWAAPGFPAAFTAVLDTSDLEVEPFDDNPPTLVFGSPPPAFAGVLPDAPGINLSFTDPTLTVNLPAAPALLSLSVVPFGGTNMPTFSAADPVLTAVEPSIREYVPGSQYTSALLTALKTSLQSRITTGGTGLNQNVENAIWDRGREREFRTQADALKQLDQMEGLGYAAPPGAYLDARTKIITETDYALRGHSREVMIKSAELELDNVKHALTTATQLEGELIQYTNSVEQRLFESTKYATEAGISIYNAKVQAFASMVEVYRTKVQIYQAQIQAEMSKVEVYKAQIEAEQTKAQINQSLVAMYKVQVDAALANVDIYKAEIAGIQAKADIEKTKVEAFGAQVQGYTAQINAYTAGVEGFRATVEAEKTKQQAYQSQVEAFSARVTASAKIIDARIAAFKGQIDAKTAEYDGYRAAVAGESARVDAITKIGGVQADAYKAEVEGINGYNEILTKQWQAVLDQNQRTTEIGIGAAKANAELYINTRSISLDAAKTGAQVAAQIGSAALNAINFSGSVSSSEGYSSSGSASNSASFSESVSTGLSTNYNYNASI